MPHNAGENRTGAGVDGLWERLKQRKLVQWALAYVAFAFALLQGLDIVAQQFGWPDGVRRGITLALVLGFFVVLVLAWYHGERGAQRVGGTELLILALLLVVGGALLWKFARAPQVLAKPVAAAAPMPPASAGPGARAAASTIPEKSVAVLPFANESGKPDQQFFSDGLSEDLITALSQFDGLKVISRDSAFQFRNSTDSSAKIGRLLGVAHLLEGSVQRQDDDVRITATLVNASDGTVLWSQRYDKPYKDLFALQDAITKAVSDALKAKLLTASGVVVQNDRPPSGSITAYSSYLRARADALRGPESDLRKAIVEYGDAIRLDPDYAAAYAARGVARARLLAIYLPDATHRSLQDEASADIAKALALDADSALAYRARAYVLLNLRIDPLEAERAVRRALQLAPNDADAMAMLGQVLASTGHVQQAVAVTREAIKSDPLSAIPYYWLSSYLAGLGRLDAAKQAVQTAIGLQPDGYGNYEELAIIEILRGDAKAALAAARQEQPGPWRNDALLLALQVGSDRAAADAALNHALATFAPGARYQIAQAYALRHDPDDMFKWLDRARAVDDAGLPYLLYDPLILRYRDDPRFAAFCKKAGFPESTDAVAMK